MGDDFDGLNEARAKSRCRDSLRNMVKRLKLTERTEFPNEGTCLIDGKFYYFAQSKKARVKGNQKMYQMRGFAHFLETFCTVPESGNKTLP